MSIQSTSFLKKQRRRKSLEQSNPDKIMNLIMSLTDETSALLQIKINVYLEEECKAYKIFQVIANTERMEAYIDAISGIPLPKKYKIRMSPRLVDTLKYNIEQCEALSNFDPEIQNFIGTPTQNTDITKKKIQLVPVKGSSFSVIYCVVKPNAPAEKVVQYVKECALFTWPTLSKSISLEFERTLKLKCQQLLKVAKKLFTQVATLETVLEIAKDQAKLLMKAEYCSVMLVDIDKMELYDTCPQLKTESVERRFPFNIGVAGEVMRTGMLINVRCPKEHHMFMPAIDCVPGINCRNLLCFPIREKTGIIGIGQLMNKIDDPYFDAMDEEMALAFSIYCGVCITHSMVYQKIQEAHVRNALANELVMYHMKVTDKEVEQVVNCPKRHDHPRLWSLHFNQSELPPSELPCYVLKMFTDLGFDKKYKMKHAKLCRFIVSVRKEYRQVPYHNWMHAFSVAQWSYAALVNYHLVQLGYFNDLQALMFLLAGLMHDLDHRGSSASFQLNGQTTLVALYSSEGSVMERHRLSQAMCILNTEGCDILESLPRRDFDMAIMLLRDFILATDLSNFLKSLNDFNAIAQNYQKSKSTHKMVLQCILMNAADLSDYIKDWNNVKRTAAAVLTEFFKQAEVGKKHAEIPAYMLDTKKNCVIPDLQIEFLQDICVPLFTIVEQILPHAANLVKVIESHIARWEAAKLVFSEIPLTAGLSVLLSPNLDNLIEKSVKEKEEELARLAAAAEEDD